ncbi:MAG: PIG-L family deacetylase [Bryobacteraceae bacterium]|nr:PIG-L family deacetylase [Bryobacteraceae bacterium]
MLLIVVAHYDDEVIAASHRLGADCRILHVTDSGPRNPKYFTRAGFDTREAYAAHRRQEMLRAVALAGVTEAQCEVLPVADQEAVRELPLLVAEIRRRLPGVDTVLTHAYEGGHPDHDACALACQVAVSQARREESPFYHAAHGPLVAGEFIQPPQTCVSLTPAQQARRAAMFAEFPSQGHVFSRFPLDRACARPAPVYDFLSPPHAGTLYYETRDLGFTWLEWRALAHRFLQDC